MRHGFTLSMATAGLLAGALATGPASAETYRVPHAGAPSLSVEAPSGWTGTYVGDEVEISDTADMAILELSVISDAALVARPLPEVAAQVLRDADLSPRWESTEPDSVAGLPGQAFTVTIVRNGTPMGTARVVVAKIDAGHAARMTEITMLKETSAEERAALKDLVSHVIVSNR